MIEMAQFYNIKFLNEERQTREPPVPLIIADRGLIGDGSESTICINMERRAGSTSIAEDRAA
ncbi:hypothetical protein ACIGEL_19415 [Rossellomorea aquimaris]|uniref:hypothetical protein n=1 Tax=Rossellomorea aquimaris TaxID=189382 RepID=UPI0037C67371